MGKIRVYELAKELNISSKDMLNMLNALNIKVNSHMASMDADLAQQAKKQIEMARKMVMEKRKKQRDEQKSRTRDGRSSQKDDDNRGRRGKSGGYNKENRDFSKGNTRDNRKPSGRGKDRQKPGMETDTFIKPVEKPKAQNKKGKKSRDKYKDKRYEDATTDFFEKTRRVVKKKKTKKEKIKKEPSEVTGNIVYSEDGTTIQEVAIPSSIMVKDFAETIGVPVNQIIGKLIELGIMVNQNQPIDIEAAEILAADYNIKVVEEVPEEIQLIDEFELDFEDKPEDLIHRPPVVTVMGHVDHGKTSLLDAIRNAHVTKSEAGGITQHIGAYTVSVSGKKICFLDTPGHEAFTAMRARGAEVTDISIVVVAADDGIMPQTVEAINHSKAANVPIIVAINKMDKPTANPDRIKQELLDHGLTPEDWGGKTICVPVSAIKGEGIDELLDMILIVSEVEELKANPNRPAVGTIVEAELDKGRGPVATVLVQKGTLHQGDELVSGVSYGRVRAMFNDKQEQIEEAGPSTPVVILGLSEVPEAGDLIFACEDDKTARTIAEKKRTIIREQELTDKHQVSLDYLYDQIKAGNLKDLNIIVKGDVRGSIEAVAASLEKLSNEEVKINIIHTGVGGITESDVMLASASKAIIIGFNVRPNLNAIELSKSEEVDIHTYKVIYEAIEDIEKAVKGMLKPDIKENLLGRAIIRETFKLPNNTIIAGIYVQDGKITRNASVRVLRDDVVIFDGKIGSLKRFKDDVREVQTGYEAGMSIEKYNDVKVGDVFEAYEMVEVSNG
ncbi:MAG: translation initiation factor IF-2 [Tissierellia bacterium]|nr:translation initiation factor IF-2 [Tissierellia bacterium]